MRLQIVQLTNILYNFNECTEEDLKIIFNEYEKSNSINYLFNCIIPQDNEIYSFSDRKNYYNNITNKINNNFSTQEKEMVVLFCLVLSYLNNLDPYMNNILELYEIIKEYNFSKEYFNTLKYQIELILFVFSSTGENIEKYETLRFYLQSKINKIV